MPVIEKLIELCSVVCNSFSNSSLLVNSFWQTKTELAAVPSCSL